MPRFFRFIPRILLTILILFFVLALLGINLIQKSLPQTEGEIVLKGLEDDVTVYRDNYGVPHIYSSNERDLWFAAGYVIAQDRLWQLDFTRRAAQGRLSEIFGAVTLKEDKFLRTWGFYRIAAKIIESLSDESRLALEAYADGINRYIEDYNDRLPIEFSLLEYKPEPWKVEDSIAFTRLMAFKLCYSWFYEAVLGKVTDQFGAEMAKALFPEVLKNTPTILAKNTQGFGPRIDSFLNTAQAARHRLGIPAGVLGSNSWVVSGERSTSGKPILANDPHLELTLPAAWYEMHLSSDNLDVTGMTLPGAPGILIGHNRAIAWGLTNGMADDLDFYMERINPANGGEYWSDTGWKTLEVVHEVIKIKDGESQRLQIQSTERGPLINAIHQPLSQDSVAISIRWTGFEVTDDLKAILLLNRASSWQDFQQAMQHFTVPCQNVVYADTANNIGYWACGSVPIRRDGKGWLPYQGWTSEGDWLGMIPFEEMPHAFNPPEGFIATANNKMFTERYPYYISNGWEPTSRIERITERLTAMSQVVVDSFMSIQLDQVSNHAKYVLPKLLDLLEGALTEQDTLIEFEQDIFRMLTQWDGKEDVDSVPAAVFNVWAMEFFKNTFKDELGDTLFDSYIQWTTLATRSIEYLADRPQSKWFDKEETPEQESAEQISLIAFRDALSYLNEKYGDLIIDWRWGKVHQLTLNHILGQQKPLNQIFNSKPMELGGSANTVFKTSYRFYKPYDVSVGPSMRMITDLASPENSLFILPGGQSGQPFSTHYHDQLERWRTGRYREVSMNRDKIMTTCQTILHLRAEDESTVNE